MFRKVRLKDMCTSNRSTWWIYKKTRESRARQLGGTRRVLRRDKNNARVEIRISIDSAIGRVGEETAIDFLLSGYGYFRELALDDLEIATESGTEFYL